MSPPFLFQINEIEEDPDAAEHLDNRGHWNPSREKNSHRYVRSQGLVTGSWWFCDRQRIQELNHPNLPATSQHYKTISMYYCGGLGFWILDEDALDLRDDSWQIWHPLRFTHTDPDYSSYATSAGDKPTLRLQRSDQTWPRLLLPDIYHAHHIIADDRYIGYGGLKGDLPVLLALLALSTNREELRRVLPTTFTGGSWCVHERASTRIHQRGVVVRVYTCPPEWAGGSTGDDLDDYENGTYGTYFN